jgi:hypothetical protein
MGPLMVLAALALIPFALMLALSLAAFAAGFILLRAFFPSSKRSELGSHSFAVKKPHVIEARSQVLDAEYEVKETHEKK